MRTARLFTLLLTLLAFNSYALTAVTRGHDIVHVNGVDAANAQTTTTDAMHMDCCDPDLNKTPCDPAKDGACVCKFAQGCESPQVYAANPVLLTLISSTELTPSTRASTPLLSRSSSRLLRPPIR